MKIFAQNIKIGQVFEFWGELNKELYNSDLVYIWEDRNRNGLGQEIVYGTCELIKCDFKNNLYKAKRIV